jgi:hypothetical protein
MYKKGCQDIEKSAETAVGSNIHGGEETVRNK